MKKPNGVSCVISAESSIEGSVILAGVVMISGNITGKSLCSITTKDLTKTKRSDAIIVNGGKIVVETMNTNTLYLESGMIQCKEIRAEQNLFIGSNAHVKGGILYYGDTIQIEDGAILDGCQIKHLNYCSEGEIT